MKLTLDHTQRLNLHALLGAQRADVGGVRAIWQIQDKFALEGDEERAIELKREFVGGQERAIWNPSFSIPAREFDLTQAEAARIKAAIETWSNYGAAPDRQWLEPLIDALFSATPRSDSGHLQFAGIDQNRDDGAGAITTYPCPLPA